MSKDKKLDSGKKSWHFYLHTIKLSQQFIRINSELDSGIKEKKERNKKIFDYIVLLGMVVNMIFAVFMILYYFNLL